MIGLLNFACLVVCPGKPFLRRLIDLTRNITNPFYFVKLNCEARADLHAWSVFFQSFNGKPVFLSDNWISSDHLKLFTDASGNIGCAAVFGSWWFANSWTKYLQCHQIAVKELFPIVIALELWGKYMVNSKVLFLSDNQAVVDVLNKQSCRYKILMRLVQTLCFVQDILQESLT